MEVNLLPWVDVDLVLDHRKAMYVPESQTLVISDWHLGKVSHFRKHGIGVPDQVRFANLEVFDGLMYAYKPERVLFLGDLFHSDYNLEWEEFGRFIQHYCQVDWLLVEGNHDIMHPSLYAKFTIRVHKGTLQEGELLYSHEPLEGDYEGYNLCGHIHPGVRMVGKGKQSLRLAAFHFSQNRGILPAFGNFTGKHVLKPKKRDRVFVCSTNQIIPAVP